MFVQVEHLVNPPMRTRFQQEKLNLEENCYHSSRFSPLGSSHDQSTGLPKGLDPLKTRFGMPINRETTAGELIRPPKSSKQIVEEAIQGKELYQKVSRA